ncbi:MAG: DUF445 family protein, partial [Bacteroidetes bacterium]
EFSGAIDSNLEMAWERLAIENLTKNLAKQIAEKPLNALFGTKNTENFALELQNRLSNLLQSAEGRNILITLAKELVDALEKEKSTIFSFLSVDLAQNFDLFLQKKLPIFLDSLIIWLESRKGKLEQIIDKTFRKNIKWKFQDWILDWFIGSISQYADAVKKVVEIVEQYKENPQETTAKLTAQVIDFLKKNTIGDIVKQVKNSETAKNLSDLLFENAEKALKNFKFEDLEVFLEKKIGDFFKEDAITDFLKKSLKQLMNKELKENFLYHPKLASILEDLLNKEMQKICEQKISEILPEKTFENFADQQIQNLAKNNLFSQKFLFEIIKKEILQLSVNQIVTKNNISEIRDFLSSEIFKYLDLEFAKRKNENLQSYLDRLQFLQNDLPLYLKNLIINNLPFLLKNRVAPVVTSSMQKMSEDKLRDVVEKFVGKELKPITVFGAFLGAISGGLLNFLPISGMNWETLLAAGMTYGITGYATNWLAIKMVFRPYKATKMPLLPINMPFTPSVVAKNKPRFAENMGKFVINGLLNPVSLQDTFSKKKDILKQNLIDNLSKNNFELIDQLLENQGNKISENASKFLFEKIQNTESWQTEFQNFLGKQKYITFKNIPTQNLEKQISEFLDREKNIEKAENELLRFLDNLAQSPKTLAQTIPNKDQWYAQISVLLGKRLEKLLENLNDPQKISVLLESLNPIFEKFSQRNLDTFLNVEQKTEINQKLNDLLIKNLIDSKLKKYVFDFIDQKLADELDPNRQIQHLLNGNLLRLISENLDLIVEKIIAFALTWLAENKTALSNQIYQKAYENSKTVALYQDTIKNTVLELADTEIPNFFRDESPNLKKIISQGVAEIGASKIGDLKIGLEKNYLKNLVEDLLKRPATSNSLQKLSEHLLQELYQIPLAVFLQIADLHKVSDIERTLQAEISLAAAHLYSQGKKVQQDLTGQASVFLIGVLENQFSQVQTKEILENISEKDWRKTSQKLLNLLIESPTYQTQKQNLIHDFFENFKEKELGQILDWQEFEQNLGKFAQNLSHKTEFEAFFKENYTDLIAKNLKSLNSNLESESKLFFMDFLAQTSLNTLENHLQNLLASLHLQE